MQKSTKASCQKHLGTIKDEMCSLSRMVDEDRYGIDIVKQISAVRDGLQRVRNELLRDHVAHCVEHAIAAGDKADQRLKIKELMSLTTTDMSGIWP
ncbi:copper-sensing transcriptional repressor CsoR family protein [Bradyrhizobium sp. LTSPM299]|uniref:metal-sensitive transcriptional regulator n=1 Tax=Bradyrhizobium sp. LTSPM299 TaxID=1619233 RepID=UPI0005CA4AA4|nr:metal-sensitive transcriptional regulator [Bradyrhizobium sp. LTSPM299]KJC56603.1 copper-sensing transcriptional repressor CsoR family protein [Bradyrhizobium sp. LTSPM299]